MSESSKGRDATHRGFAPGAVDYDGSISARYRAGRALSSAALAAWRVAIRPFVQPAQGAMILDLGAGTGRFVGMLARDFDAHVVGVEPSRAMLAVAAHERSPAYVMYVAGRAESLPFHPCTFHVAWLSHVFHHVRDRFTCARELRRVLHPGGRVLVRGTFGDRLDGFPTLFQFFPGARDICADLPTVPATLKIFQGSGFSLEAMHRIAQRTCGSLSEFAARTRRRADTALALLSDREFERGQMMLESAAAREETPTPIFETLDLLVLQTDAGSPGTPPTGE